MSGTSVRGPLGGGARALGLRLLGRREDRPAPGDHPLAGGRHPGHRAHGRHRRSSCPRASRSRCTAWCSWAAASNRVRGELAHARRRRSSGSTWPGCGAASTSAASRTRRPRPNPTRTTASTPRRPRRASTDRAGPRSAHGARSIARPPTAHVRRAGRRARPRRRRAPVGPPPPRRPVVTPGRGDDAVVERAARPARGHAHDAVHRHRRLHLGGRAARRPALGGGARAPRPHGADGGGRAQRHRRQGQRRRLPDRVRQRPPGGAGRDRHPAGHRVTGRRRPRGPGRCSAPACTPARWCSATATCSAATSSRPPASPRRPTPVRCSCRR